MVYLIVGNLLIVAAAAALFWLRRKLAERKMEDKALSATYNIVTNVAMKMGGIGHAFGLARVPLALAEADMFREIQMLISREMLQLSHGKKCGGDLSANRRADFREQMLDDLLKSGSMNAVPSYIEPEKLLEIFRDTHHNPKIK